MTAADEPAIARTTMRKVSVRLLPFLFVLYIANFLDRTNVSIAALQMNRDLHFSPAAFSLGAGIFFIGYALFEVPSNLFLARVGARWWIARIMFTWGVIATAMMFVQTPMQFYALRFLLGVAEAGFFPGVIFYLSNWFPASQRARAVSRFLIAIPVAGVLGGAIGGWLLGLDGRAGLAGWQWLFVLEGLPSVLLSVTVLYWLTDKPADAQWLTPAQREWLIAKIESEQTGPITPHGIPPLRALANPMLWLVSLAYVLVNTSLYAYTFWGPTIIKESLNTTNTQTGYVVALIACVSTAIMLTVSVSSDRKNERYLHAAFAATMVAAGCAGAALMPTPILRIAFLGMVQWGANSFLSPFFCIPPMLFRGASLAVAIALVNSIGNLGGFLGPNVISSLKSVTGSDTGAFLSLSVVALISAVICVRLRPRNASVASI